MKLITIIAIIQLFTASMGHCSPRTDAYYAGAFKYCNIDISNNRALLLSLTGTYLLGPLHFLTTEQLLGVWERKIEGLQHSYTYWSPQTCKAIHFILDIK